MGEIWEGGESERGHEPPDLFSSGIHSVLETQAEGFPGGHSCAKLEVAGGPYCHPVSPRQAWHKDPGSALQQEAGVWAATYPHRF